MQIDNYNQVQHSAEQDKTPWKRIYEEYKKNTAGLKEKYSPLLREELLSKQSKDSYSLANIFKNIAEANIGLARAVDTNQSLKLYHYNDGAIACHHGLSVIEKANCNNNPELQKLQELEKEICGSLNDIQTDMVSFCGGRSELLQNISNKEALSNISKYGLLEQLRTTTKEQIKAIAAAKLAKNDAAYIDLTANVFKQVANGMGQYLGALYGEAEKILGPPPCDYHVIGLGSMALRQMTPYSDLEFAILTDNEHYKQIEDFTVREYFRNLTQLVHFKVINLGETIMPISSYGFDFKDFIKTAVNFDLGGKTPLGRMDKPYELIQTVDGMVNYLKNEDDKTSHIDKTLLFILQKSCPIYKHGNKDLATEYQSQANEFLLSTDETNSRPYCENRAVQVLAKGGVEIDYTKQTPEEHKTTGNLKQFSFDAYESQGKLFDVKQEIYRMPDRFIYNLGMIHGIQEDSSWDTIDELCEQGIINAEGADNLKKALSFATNLRLKVYSSYKYQKDTMDFAKAYEVQSDLSSEDIEKELTTVFKLAHEDLQEGGALFQYYYTALALRKKLKDFCQLDDSNQKEAFFNNNTFYQNNANIKAQINLRLLRYEDALKWQLEEWAILQESLGDDHTDVANSLNNIGDTYGYLGDANTALEYKEKALEIRKKSLGDDHPDVATSLDNVGVTYGELGEYGKALEYQEKALEIRKKSLGMDHPDVGESFNNIGYTYGDLGDHRKALEYQEKALEIRKKSLGMDHPDVGESFNNIGCTYGSLGEHNKALEYQEKALEISQKSFGEDHPDVGESFNNIGCTYGSLGEHKQALEYQEKALAIFQKSLGNDHPDVATSYNNIGYTYGEFGDHRKALEYQEKALEIQQKSLGQDHADVALSYNNIGSTYGALGDHRKALEYMEQALVIRQKSLGEDHPDIALSYNNIGRTYGELGYHHKALEYAEKALEIQQKSLSEDHPDVALSYNNIGSTYGALGDHNKALEYQEKALEIQQKSLSEDHPDVARSYNYIGSTYGDLGNHKTALEYQKKALEIRQKFLGDDHPDVAISLKNLGISYNGLVQYQEALKCHERALEIVWKNNTKDHPDIIKYKYLLVDTYCNLKSYNKALDQLNSILDLYQKSEQSDQIDKISNCKQKIDNIVSILETNSTFTDIPEKSEEGVRVISYNITADFFDNKDNTADQHHHWKYRAPFVKVLLKKLYPDIMCLQELSAEQALELHQYFTKGGYKSIFLSQTPSEIETGAITYGGEVKGWTNKFLGASLIGTFINKSFEFIETGRFWLNENPDLVPTIKDRGEADKGFGNMNTYRAILWAKVKIEGNKSLYIFNSHYPLSGNNETRFNCAELEMNKIQEITEGDAWVSVGDKNIIPTKDDNEQYNPQTVYDKLTKHGKNIIQGGDNHHGPSTTWIGFTYDPYKNEINEGGEFNDSSKLDVIVSNLDSTCSFHHHGAFDPSEFRLTPLTDSLTEEHNKQRYFASDHAVIGADFIMDNNP